MSFYIGKYTKNFQKFQKTVFCIFDRFAKNVYPNFFLFYYNTYVYSITWTPQEVHSIEPLGAGPQKNFFFFLQRPISLLNWDFQIFQKNFRIFLFLQKPRREPWGWDLVCGRVLGSPPKIYTLQENRKIKVFLRCSKYWKNVKFLKKFLKFQISKFRIFYISWAPEFSNQTMLYTTYTTYILILTPIANI